MSVKFSNDDISGDVRATGLRRARRRSLSQEIADQLLELIVSSGSAEYVLPPERVLCEQLGVSRTPLREALSALDQQGVLETHGKSRIGFGARARTELVSRVGTGSMERDVLSGPLEARRMLEPEVAAKAAQQASEEALDEIGQWIVLMERSATRGERNVEYDSAFHVSIARATGNRTLVDLIGALTTALQESRELSFRPTSAAQQAIADHWNILEALRSRDVEGARQAMQQHLDQVEQLILSYLKTTTDEQRGE